MAAQHRLSQGLACALLNFISVEVSAINPVSGPCKGWLAGSRPVLPGSRHCCSTKPAGNARPLRNLHGWAEFELSVSVSGRSLQRTRVSVSTGTRSSQSACSRGVADRIRSRDHRDQKPASISSGSHRGRPAAKRTSATVTWMVLEIRPLLLLASVELPNRKPLASLR